MSGYSQWLAKYCRHKCSVSYRSFYDRLFMLLQQNCVFKDYFYQLRNTVDHYLMTGKILAGSFCNGGHILHAGSYQFIYDNITDAYAISQTVAESFCEVDKSIIELQSAFLYQPSNTYPVEIDLPFDIYTWAETPTRYQVESKIKDITTFDFYRYRRKNLIKNRIITID